VVAFIQGRNTGAETGLATNQVASGGGGFVGGAACASAFALNLPGKQQDNIARTNNNTQPVEIAQPDRRTSESLSQTVQSSKRDRGTVGSYSRANSWLKSSTVKVMQDKTP